MGGRVFLWDCSELELGPLRWEQRTLIARPSFVSLCWYLFTCGVKIGFWDIIYFFWWRKLKWFVLIYCLCLVGKNVVPVPNMVFGVGFVCILFFILLLLLFLWTLASSAFTAIFQSRFLLFLNSNFNILYL